MVSKTTEKTFILGEHEWLHIKWLNVGSQRPQGRLFRLTWQSESSCLEINLITSKKSRHGTYRSHKNQLKTCLLHYADRGPLCHQDQKRNQCAPEEGYPRVPDVYGIKWASAEARMEELTAASCNEEFNTWEWKHEHTNPVYIPNTLPFGSATGQRAPQPHCFVLKTSIGTSRGFWATRLPHNELQLQYCSDFSTIGVTSDKFVPCCTR